MTLLHHFVTSNIHMYTNLLYNVINVNVFFAKIKPVNEKFSLRPKRNPKSKEIYTIQSVK